MIRFSYYWHLTFCSNIITWAVISLQVKRLTTGWKPGNRFSKSARNYLLTVTNIHGGHWNERSRGAMGRTLTEGNGKKHSQRGTVTNTHSGALERTLTAGDCINTKNWSGVTRWRGWAMYAFGATKKSSLSTVGHTRWYPLVKAYSVSPVSFAIYLVLSHK
jgi:hypothetical protein